jgi:hypothetical protein
LTKIFVSALALSVALALVGPAMATSVSSSGGSVAVNINVLPTVSMWSNDATIALTLSGANAENSNAVASSLSVINNVDANIKAGVTGTFPADLPAGQSALNFFIFNGYTLADAYSAIVANSNAPGTPTPPAALVWNADNTGDKTLIASTGINQNIVSKPIVYAADAPNSLPLPGNFGLVVTYTITSN